MFPALRRNGLARWQALVLALFGLAALLCLSLALATDGPRGRAGATASLQPPDADLRAGDARALASVTDTTSGTRREHALEGGIERLARVQSATETLAQDLQSPGFEDERWRASVDATARELGLEALPALRAMLADDTRSAEEHVAASRLAAALRAR